MVDISKYSRFWYQYHAKGDGVCDCCVKRVKNCARSRPLLSFLSSEKQEIPKMSDLSGPSVPPFEMI